MDEVEKTEHRKAKEANTRNAASAVGVGNLAIAIVLIGFGIGLLLALIAILRNMWLFMIEFPLFWGVLVLGLAALIGMFFLTARFWPSLIVACLVAFGSYKGAAAIYNSRYFPSVYCVDYVWKLPDGSMPKFYEKRKYGGAELEALTPGQWVKVNGITFDKKWFNVTTYSTGTTGWVERGAFPKKAADWLFDRMGSDGSLIRQIPIDRQAEEYTPKYLDDKKFNAATLQKSVRVGATTPFMRISREDLKNGTDTFSQSGMTVTLERIAYTPDCTMICLSLDTPDDYYKYQSLGHTFEALVAKDLDTGATYDVIPGKYRSAEWEEGGKANVVLFFWPFASRHFSLTHTAHPQLDKRGGGLLGKLASVVSLGGKVQYEYFSDWNFPEVNVR